MDTKTTTTAAPAAAADPVAAAGQAIIQHDHDVAALLAQRAQQLEILVGNADHAAANEHRRETNELAVSAINRRLELARLLHLARVAAERRAGS
jgi:hypothetical protein